MSPLPCSLLPPARKATTQFPFLLFVSCQLAKLTSDRVCKDIPARCEGNIQDIFLSSRRAVAELSGNIEIGSTSKIL